MDFRFGLVCCLVCEWISDGYLLKSSAFIFISLFVFFLIFSRFQSQQTGKQDFSDTQKPEKLRYEDLEEHIYTLEGKF